ncbi:MAG: hypothetical protein AB1543_01815 [Candidatus Bipolaricaulota bacterium]
MRIRVLILLVFAVGAMAQVTLSPPPAAGEVLDFLQTMLICPDLKAKFAPVLATGLSAGRASSQYALPFLQQLSVQPSAQAEEALAVIHRALERGFIVDPLMNDVLKGLQMRQPWERVKANLGIRYNSLVAAQHVLLQYGIIGIGPQAPGGPLLPQDRLVLEMAWAVGDYYFVQPQETLEAYVRSRLLRLRGSVLDTSVVDPLLAVLTQDLVQQIYQAMWTAVN